MHTDRRKVVSEPLEIDAWVVFDYPGRAGKYSTLRHRWVHFNGVDYDNRTDRNVVFKFIEGGKDWSDDVDDEFGNADFLMFANLDYTHPEVRDDAKRWAVWITKECGLSGFRFDAMQHMPQNFMIELAEHLHDVFGDQNRLCLIGEFWMDEPDHLLSYLDRMRSDFMLFDSALVSRFNQLSTTEAADLRTVFDKTVVKEKPNNAATCVMNHDTQPGSTVEKKIEDFFKPLAYALILLRQEGYPSLFWGDLYGTKGAHAAGPSCGGQLPVLSRARKLYAYGQQDDYFDEPNCIGFVRRGTWDRKDGLACVMSNAEPGQKRMAVGPEHRGEIWTDLLGWEKTHIEIDAEGYGLFPCATMSVSVWVNQNAEGRDMKVDFDTSIY
jgi:alpha-amylase